MLLTSNIALLRCLLNELLAALKGFFIKADGNGLSMNRLKHSNILYLSQNETNVLYLNFQKPKTFMCIVPMDAILTLANPRAKRYLIYTLSKKEVTATSSVFSFLSASAD